MSFYDQVPTQLIGCLVVANQDSKAELSNRVQEDESL